WLWSLFARHSLGQKLFEGSHPAPQLKIIRPSHEEMNMVRHDHITPNRYVVLGVGVFAELNEAGIDSGICEQRCATISADRYEKNRIAGEYPYKSRRNLGVLLHLGRWNSIRQQILVPSLQQIGDSCSRRPVGDAENAGKFKTQDFQLHASL